MVSQKCVTEHHLSHSDSAAPADIVGQSDLELPVLALSDCSQEYLDLVDIILQEWSEISSVAEPQETPELLLEVVLYRCDLLLELLIALCVDLKDVIKKENWQLIWSLDFYLVRSEKFDNRTQVGSGATLISCGLELVSCIEHLTF